MKEPATLHSIAQSLVLLAIRNCGSASEQKARIIIAREHGHLTDAEAQDWLAVLELKAA